MTYNFLNNINNYNTILSQTNIDNYNTILSQNNIKKLYYKNTEQKLLMVLNSFCIDKIYFNEEINDINEIKSIIFKHITLDNIQQFISIITDFIISDELIYKHFNNSLSNYHNHIFTAFNYYKNKGRDIFYFNYENFPIIIEKFLESKFYKCKIFLKNDDYTYNIYNPYDISYMQQQYIINDIIIIQNVINKYYIIIKDNDIIVSDINSLSSNYINGECTHLVLKNKYIIDRYIEELNSTSLL